MKERPILFSAPMVRAILSGAKTQTRRVVKDARGAFWDHAGWRPARVSGDGVVWWRGVEGRPIHGEMPGGRSPYAAGQRL